MSNVKEYLKEHTNPPVFIFSAIMVLAFVGWGVIAPGNLGTVADTIKSWISTVFGWWYLLAVSGFLIFAIVLLVTPYGSIKLGKAEEEPEWSTFGWFSMLFTAGMGIGLVFYGVAEPIFHYTAPPNADPQTAAAARDAMNITFFHWGLHAWAVYIVIGLSLGYFCFRYDLPLRPASALYPLIGDRIYGWIGNVVDILAVFGTLFGLATSLGLGASQISAGLSTIFGTPDNATVQVLIIGVVTAVAVTSVMAGLNKGVRRLSVVNLWLAIFLAAAVFIAGPTLFILQFMVGSTGHYLQHLPETSLRMFVFDEEAADWLSAWTLFYWGWWIAWSPFVGMFIARISRGRTIRQFVAGCLLAPTGASIVWFTIFGGSAIKYIRDGNGAEALIDAGTNDALFVLLEQLPMASVWITVLAALGIVVVAIFFATSSDSGSLVVDMLTNGGDPNPIWQQRMFWAILEGVVAAVLLVAGSMTDGNPLVALQTAAITSGLPFSIVIALMCWGLIRQLRFERAGIHKVDEKVTPRHGSSSYQPAPAVGRES
ncbi:BCCT family transporter [Amorphus orientalis]|uniref:Choline/glycine/proline betaine transport protein n=1 Tax=Amorphus orientalis TaxID=649198 RepID=A0AAE3VQ76_9HYPH|nr:BCCT family transporter [Amorphus orientalis]MDQ0316145.1 choline/glycine/proline betaine transport protein [Amorphus orientalis]